MTNSLVLIIEDDPDLSTIFAEALKVADFDTKIARDGKTALTLLNQIVPDIVILDLHLPHASGKDVLEHIRGDSRLSNTKVILATADASMADTLESQADLVLLKPISFGQLGNLAARLRPPDTTED